MNKLLMWWNLSELVMVSVLENTGDEDKLKWT